MKMFESEIRVLNVAIQTMDIPADRRYLGEIENIVWMKNNLGIKNSDHRHFSQAMTILNSILKGENK